MGKSVFSRLLMGLTLLATTAVVVVSADGDDGVHPLRTHSLYMPYIGKTSALRVPFFGYGTRVERRGRKSVRVHHVRRRACASCC